jgi:hypothetical protein
MKESTAAYEKALKAIAKDRQLDMISKKDKETLVKIAKLMQKANESAKNEGFSSGMIKYAIGLADKYAGNMTKAVKLIDKVKKGLSDDPKVKAALQAANESVDEALPNPPLTLSKSQLKGMIKRAKSAGARGYDIIISMSRDLSVTSDEMVSTLEKHRLIGMTEDNTMKENKFKSAVRDRIKVALRKNLLRMEDEDSVADTDMKTAKKLRKPLRNAIEGISNSVDNINRMMSDFNAPGLRVAFLYAIKKNINTQTQKFDMRGALKEFEDYFKDR